MKKYKFRWYDASGEPVYRIFSFPNDTEMLIGLDADGRKVFEGARIQGADGKIGKATIVAKSFIDCFKLVER